MNVEKRIFSGPICCLDSVSEFTFTVYGVSPNNISV